MLYSAGDILSLPAEEAERSKYRQLGWSPSTTAETPEYDVSGEITVTESMVNAGVLDLYVTWSTYYIGQLLENVTDVDGKTQTGYVAYICGKNDSVKVSSSKPSESWTYLIVSKYGANRLTDVTWSNATFTDAYLPAKAEMETIITNLWEDSSSRQWKIFSDGSSTSSNWDYYWTATADDADSSKAYYASVTTNSNVTGTYAGLVTSTKNKSETLKAISDPVRRDILNMLKEERKSAGEIAEKFNLTGDFKTPAEMLNLKNAEEIVETIFKKPQILITLKPSKLEALLDNTPTLVDPDSYKTISQEDFVKCWNKIPSKNKELMIRKMSDIIGGAMGG